MLAPSRQKEFAPAHQVEEHGCGTQPSVLSSRLAVRGHVCHCSLLEAAETQLHDSAREHLRNEYAALTSPALTISLEGFAQGPGSSWRHANGLVGAKTFGEQELQRLALDELTGAA